MRLLLAALTATALTLACGSPDASRVDGAPLVGWGTFGINESLGGGGSFSGRFLSHRLPEAPEKVREGACAYFEPSPSFCEPACGADATCVDGACVPYPTELPVGHISVEGAAQPIEVPSATQYSWSTPTGDLLPDGATITMRAMGEGAVAPFERSVRPIEPLPAPAPLTAREHEPLVVSWPPSSDPTDATVTVRLDNDHHGIVAYVECEAPDADGSLTIAPAVLDPLILAGETGIGTYIENAWIYRARRDRRQEPGGATIGFTTGSKHVLDVTTVRAP